MFAVFSWVQNYFLPRRVISLETGNQRKECTLTRFIFSDRNETLLWWIVSPLSRASKHLFNTSSVGFFDYRVYINSGIYYSYLLQPLRGRVHVSKLVTGQRIKWKALEYPVSLQTFSERNVQTFRTFFVILSLGNLYLETPCRPSFPLCNVEKSTIFVIFCVKRRILFFNNVREEE